MDYTQVKNDEHDYLMPTYGRFDAVLTHGKGAAAYGADEKEYIDFTSGIGVNALGYSDDGWVKAVTGQALKIQHISNLYYSPVQTQLAKALCEKTGFDKVFFTNSGAEANECAIKLARKYSFETFDPSRTSIVCLKIRSTAGLSRRFRPPVRMCSTTISSHLPAALRLRRQTILRA